MWSDHRHRPFKSQRNLGKEVIIKGSELVVHEVNLSCQYKNLIILYSCSRITDQGFEDVVESLKRMNSLQRLSISCPYSDWFIPLV